MGRSEALPKSFFGAIDAKHRVPETTSCLSAPSRSLGRSSLLMILDSTCSTLARSSPSWESMLPRFFGIIGARKRRNWQPDTTNFWVYHLLPAVAESQPPRDEIGSVWMAVGIAFGIWRTKGFTKQLSFEVPPRTRPCALLDCIRCLRPDDGHARNGE